MQQFKTSHVSSSPCLNKVDSCLCMHGESNPSLFLLTDHMVDNGGYCAKMKAVTRCTQGKNSSFIILLSSLYCPSPYTHVSSERTCTQGQTGTSC